MVVVREGTARLTVFDVGGSVIFGALIVFGIVEVSTTSFPGVKPPNKTVGCDIRLPSGQVQLPA